MIEGISPTTLNRYRVEDNVLKFLGRSHDSNILQYEVNVGDDEDAYFAAEFLSGKMKNFVLLSPDMNIMRGLVEEDVQINKSAWNTISFGVYCYDPHQLGEICKARPSALFSVIPYEWDDLRVIGKLVNSEPAAPSIMPLQCERTGKSGLSLNLDYFTPNLPQFPDTMLVHMSKCVDGGHEAFCLFYSPPCDDGFGHRFIVKDETEECDICLMTEKFADECFGFLPLSYRTSAACSFPTEIAVTDEFRKRTGCKRDTVNILISDHHNEPFSRFMRMYNFVAHRQWCWSKKTCADGRCNVFTYDGFGFCDKQTLNDWRKCFGPSRTL